MFEWERKSAARRDIMARKGCVDVPSVFLPEELSVVTCTLMEQDIWLFLCGRFLSYLGLWKTSLQRLTMQQDTAAQSAAK